MEFSKVCEYVNSKLKGMSLIEKINLFKDFFKSPIDYKDGVFYFSNKESTETRIADYISIRAHWMNTGEFDRLYDLFKSKETVDKN